MSALRIGSLCSGAGMLDLAVESVFPGARLAWYAQYEPPDRDGKPDRHQYAARVMAHHWPGVPNHGDITAIDYAGVEPVDILTAGFPCTDLSLAGKRAGLMPGTRSGVWSHVARAIGALRPPLVLIENVRSLTSAKAHSDLESCPGCVGGPGDGDPAVPHLRALGCVLGDLADLGFDAQWLCLPAAAVGAPHKRERVFVLAWPADASPRADWWASSEDAHQSARGERRLAAPGQAPGGRARPDARGRGGAPAADPAHLGHERDRVARDRWPGSAHGGLVASDAQGVGWRERRPEPARIVGGPDADQRGGAAAADTPCTGRQRPRPQPDPARSAAPDPDEPALGTQRHREPERPETDHGRHRLDASGRFLGWGPYTAAVERWERVLGRPAPSPVDDRGRLSPLLPEWMMGLPEGHVTAVPGIPRNAQLHALGNGCVVQQAANALRLLWPAYLAATTTGSERAA